MRAAHLAPVGAAGHQVVVEAEEAPGRYGEEGCGEGGRGVRAVGVEEAAEVAGMVPADLQILP